MAMGRSMWMTPARRPHGAAEEVAAAGEHAQRAEDQGDRAEEPGVLERPPHAEIHREGEQHDVHRERAAEADAPDEGAALGLAGFLAGGPSR
jgi:hypothetical protein